MYQQVLDVCGSFILELRIRSSWSTTELPLGGVTSPSNRRRRVKFLIEN